MLVIKVNNAYEWDISKALSGNLNTPILHQLDVKRICDKITRD